MEKEIGEEFAVPRVGEFSPRRSSGRFLGIEMSVPTKLYPYLSSSIPHLVVRYRYRGTSRYMPDMHGAFRRRRYVTTTLRLGIVFVKLKHLHTLTLALHRRLLRVSLLRGLQGAHPVTLGSGGGRPHSRARITTLPLLGFFGRANRYPSLPVMSTSQPQRTCTCSAAGVKINPRTLYVSSTDMMSRCATVITPHHHMSVPRLTERIQRPL